MPSSLPLLPFFVDYQTLSSLSGTFPSMTPSQEKILIISNSITIPGSIRTGTNPTQMSLAASVRASEKSQTAHRYVLNTLTPSTSYGTGVYIPTAAKKSPTPRFYVNSNPTRREKNRTQITVRGNHIIYPGDVGTKTAPPKTLKLVANSVISCTGARFYRLDIIFTPKPITPTPDMLASNSLTSQNSLSKNIICLSTPMRDGYTSRSTNVSMAYYRLACFPTSSSKIDSTQWDTTRPLPPLDFGATNVASSYLS